MKSKKFDSFLKRVFEATGLVSQNKLAKVLGVHRSAISQAKRKDAVPERWNLKLADLYGLNPVWLETGTGPKHSGYNAVGGVKFKKIPKVKARLCAGSGSFETEEAVEEYYTFQTSWLSRKGDASKMVLLDIFGNSMEPELKDGDTVLIDQSRNDILAGALYAVGIDDAVMVKRVEKRPEKLALLSDNPNYPPVLIEKDEMHGVRIIGKVIWLCRELA